MNNTKAAYVKIQVESPLFISVKVGNEIKVDIKVENIQDTDFKILMLLDIIHLFNENKHSNFFKKCMKFIQIKQNLLKFLNTLLTLQKID